MHCTSKFQIIFIHMQEENFKLESLILFTLILICSYLSGKLQLPADPMDLSMNNYASQLLRKELRILVGLH